MNRDIFSKVKTNCIGLLKWLRICKLADYIENELKVIWSKNNVYVKCILKKRVTK